MPYAELDFTLYISMTSHRNRIYYYIVICDSSSTKSVINSHN